MNKKSKIKLIISLSAVGLVVLLIGVYFLIGFCVPPTSHTLKVHLSNPRLTENILNETDTFSVGDEVCINAFLFSGKSFFYQKILYADAGPIYCTVTIQADEGTEEQKIKLLTTAEYLNLDKNKDIETVPHTTLAVERMSKDIMYYQYAVSRRADFKFTKAGTYTFMFYAAFQQLGKNFYIEETPDSILTVIVME